MDRAHEASGTGGVGASEGSTPSQGSPTFAAGTFGALLERARERRVPDDSLLLEIVAPEQSSDSDNFPVLETVNKSVVSPRALSLAVGLRMESPVHLLRKTDRNPFAGMITVGRAPNNDVVVAHTSVSKFHAYFRPKRGHELSIFDVGSTNGTHVDGRAVPLDGAPLSTLNRITIGERAFLFIARSDVAIWLSTQLEESASR
jgi:hypothetical protein